jgi:hypothetical protein
MSSGVHPVSQSVIFPLCRNSPTLARAASFLRFVHHAKWHNTVGRTPLDDGSDRYWDFYLTTLNTHKRHTHGPGRIQTRNPNKRATADPRLRPLFHWYRLLVNANRKLSCRGVNMTILLQLMPRLRMGGAMPPTPRTTMACTGATITVCMSHAFRETKSPEYKEGGMEPVTRQNSKIGTLKTWQVRLILLQIIIRKRTLQHPADKKSGFQVGCDREEVLFSARTRNAVIQPVTIDYTETATQDPLAKWSIY